MSITYEQKEPNKVLTLKLHFHIRSTQWLKKQNFCNSLYEVKIENLN